jgi:hypothetical protein
MLSFICQKDLQLIACLCFKIACATAGEVKQWMEAFDQGKQQVQGIRLERGE